MDPAALIANATPLQLVATVVAVLSAALLLYFRASGGDISSIRLPDRPAPGRRGLCRVYFAARPDARPPSLDALRRRLVDENPHNDDGGLTAELTGALLLMAHGRLRVAWGTRDQTPAYFDADVTGAAPRGVNPELTPLDEANLSRGDRVFEVALDPALVNEPTARFLFEHTVFALADLTGGSIVDTARGVARSRRMFGASIRPLPAEDA